MRIMEACAKPCLSRVFREEKSTKFISLEKL